MTVERSRGRASQFTEEKLGQYARRRLPHRRRRRARPGAGGRVRELHPGRRRLPRHPRRGPASRPYSDWFTGLIGARPRGQPDDRAAGDRRGRRPAAPGHQGPAAGVEAARQVAQLGEEPVRHRAHRGPACGSARTQPGPSANGWDHPVSWCRDYDGGRSFYTGMGGTAAATTRRDFRTHLRGALLWTTRPGAGRLQGDDRRQLQGRAADAPSPTSRGSRPDRRAARPGHAPDGRVFYIGRGGARRARRPWSPTGTTRTSARARARSTSRTRRPRRSPLAGALDVFGNKGGGDELVKVEEGLLGIELDPDFEHERLDVPALHAALADRPRHAHRPSAASPASPSTWRRTSWTWAREKVLLKWPVPDPQLLPRGRRHGLGLQGQPVHRAPVTTTPRGFSGGYSGNNPGSPNYKGVSFADARRTAGNTNNLNGKILRIHPEPDGTYTLPRRATSSPARRPTRAAARPAARST